jgi:hypothetical protein
VLYFHYKNGRLQEITTEYVPGSVNRNDFNNFGQATQIAAEASALTGHLYIATDAGDHVYPRYDVIKAPAVGDLVSKAFNGDYYPCGKIVKISDSLKRVETDTGEVFWRRKNSGQWLSQRTWSMVGGHISKLNPEF